MNKKNYTCPECKRETNALMCSSEEQIAVCFDCHKKREAKEKEKKAENNKEKMFCDNCKEEFSDLEKLRKHEQEECKLRSKGGTIRGELNTFISKKCSFGGSEKRD